MARLASESKMGYYPTCTKTIKKVIDTCLIFDTNKTTFALDCCAGDGNAINFFKENYDCKTYAVEINEIRAKKIASKNINLLNADALYGVRKSNDWVGINFLNPPYDVGEGGIRTELSFIERWGLATTVGGILILVINPSSADSKIAKILQVQGYKPLYSFYDDENEDFNRFGQFFVILKKQSPSFRAPIEQFMFNFENKYNINIDNSINKVDVRPGKEPSLFKEIDIPRWKQENYLKKSNLRKLFFDELRSVDFINSSIEHPNEGQAAILIASGALNKKTILKNGEEVYLKGTTKKEIKKVSKFDECGEVTSVKEIDFYTTMSYGLSITHGEFIKYN